MIAEVGHACLWLALAFAALQLVAGLGPPSLRVLVAPAAYAQAALLATALACLVLVFQSVDLSVETVVAQADFGLPPLFRLAAVWANPPGVLMVSTTLLALAGAGLAMGSTPLAHPLRIALLGLALDAAIVLGFDPFQRAIPAPTAGNGLAAVLQNPMLVPVTPLLAAGGVALAVAVLLYRDGGRRWLWASTALFAAAGLLRAWATWHQSGLIEPDPTMAATLILWAATLAAAFVACPPGKPIATAIGLGAAMTIAVACCGTWTADAALPVTAPVSVAGHDLRLIGVAPAAGPNWTAVEAIVAVTRGGRTRTLHPQQRDYGPSASAIAVTGVLSAWDGDLAVTTSPGKGATIPIRVAWRPLLSWAWLGGVVVVLASGAAAVRAGRRG